MQRKKCFNVHFQLLCLAKLIPVTWRFSELNPVYHQNIETEINVHAHYSAKKGKFFFYNKFSEKSCNIVVCGNI